MTISVRKAFHRTTTQTVMIEVYVAGNYDDNNDWVGEGWESGVSISCTCVPYGDKQSRVKGMQIKPTRTGDRLPSFMKFTSRSSMPFNSLITVYGVKYKMIRNEDFTSSGFHRNIGVKEIDK